MYVCICNALTEHQVDAAVQLGADRASKVYDAFGCSPQCGKCVRDVVDKLRERAQSGESDDELIGLGR